uniref:Cell growth regulator with RING finger domain protein 1 n=1 Tax=Latimeria chalumnae TaxID=7897 RepID=H3BII3_LATCH
FCLVHVQFLTFFYILLLFCCFFPPLFALLTTFGWDVPVILRNSEETESRPRVPKKRMVQVKNPFVLEIDNPTAASLTNGINLKLNCIENCVLTCYWGCGVQSLHEALNKHICSFRIKSPQKFEDIIKGDCLHRNQFLVEKDVTEEKLCLLPEDVGIKDLGSIPRTRYPLVALLTLAAEEDREAYEIVSEVSVIHVPDEKYGLSCRMLYQYLLTAQGQVYDLKQLFMSANDNTQALNQSLLKESSVVENLLEKFGASGDELERIEENGKDCVVCQNAMVNWVLLPCRHACLCDMCVKYFQQCPMCRQFVHESFALSNRANRFGESGTLA